MELKKLDKIFNPKTIAVIGATSKRGKVGYSVFRNLVGSEYEGTVYPINPNRESVQGVKAYPTVKDVEDKIDIAIIATPSKTVPKIVEQCGDAGIEGIIILSSGFEEHGKKGKEMSNKILKIARKNEMRIMGPNCLGFLNPSQKLNATFSENMPKKGNIAFISQSGALGTAVLDWAVENNIGFSYFFSIGSMIDISFHDLIDYLGRDPKTNSILIYMESLSDARRFMSAARAFARTKPIIVLKVGQSSEGAEAAMSHTGTLTGNDKAFQAAFNRAGIIRVNTIDQLFNCAQNLAMQKRPKGKKLAIITNAGGPGVIATDYLTKKQGELTKLSKTTMKKLNKILPETWSKNNPVDILGDADSERYKKAVKICMEDENVDGCLVILTPQSMTDPTEVAKKISSIENKKTLLTSWMGEKKVEKGREILRNNNIPCFATPENAIRSFIDMYHYDRNLRLLYETPGTIPHAFNPKKEENKKIIKKILDERRTKLTEKESKKILSNYYIPVTKNEVVQNQKDAVKVASKIGFPVVMKIVSPDIQHKTEINAVKINIKTKEEVKKAFKELIKNTKKKRSKAKIQGVLVEEMKSKKYELLIGSKKDPIFGPLIVFGMGGIAVEVFKDTNVGLPPLNMALAKRLMEKTKIYKLLKGYRNMERVDLKSIQFLLYKLAYLVSDFPEIKEIDINPFSVDKDGGIVLDAKIILDKKGAKQKKPYSHLVISPYPKEYIKTFKTEKGKKIKLRPIKPEDEPLEAEMFRNFSKETERFRFFRTIKEITHELLIRYTQIDYDREIAIIAETEEGGKKKMTGVVRLIEDPYRNNAEFAIVVADPWQKQGIGNKLTDYILEIAKDRGIKKIYAEFLKDNYIMKKMLEERGFEITDKEDIYHAELKLQN